MEPALPVQPIVFRTPDWEDGYGDNLLVEPPPERTVWFALDDRDGIVAMLRDCARETIANVGWHPRLHAYEGRKRSPLLWRVTPSTNCRWAGHVWDACTVGPDGERRILLRLMVLFVDWRLHGQPIWGPYSWSRLPRDADERELLPHISPYAADGEFAVFDGSDLDRSVDLNLDTTPGAVHREAVDLRDRATMEQALHDAVVENLESRPSWKVGDRSHEETDSHFGRWYALELDRLLADAPSRPVRAWDWSPEALTGHRAAYAAALARGDVPADLPCTLADYRALAWTRSYPFNEGVTCLRLIVNDIVWNKGRVADLHYIVEPELTTRPADAPSCPTPPTSMDTAIQRSASAG